MISTYLNTENEPSKLEDLGPTFAVILMRIWLGIRSFQAGFEKFADKFEVILPAEIEGEVDANGMTIVMDQKFYALENYQGVPTGLSDSLKTEPLIYEFMLTSYNYLLGPMLLIFGISVLLGFATRIALLGMGLLYTSLTFGLILLNQSAGIAWLAVHVIMVALTLLYIRNNKFEIGNFFVDRFGMKFLLNK